MKIYVSLEKKNTLEVSCCRTFTSNYDLHWHRRQQIIIIIITLFDSHFFSINFVREEEIIKVIIVKRKWKRKPILFFVRRFHNSTTTSRLVAGYPRVSSSYRRVLRCNWNRACVCSQYSAALPAFGYFLTKYLPLFLYIFYYLVTPFRQFTKNILMKFSS